MPTLSEALEIAMAHYRAGGLRLAEEVCRRVVARDPNHADALHLLGVIARETGQPRLAVEHLRRAVASAPLNAEYHNNLALALKDHGDLPGAIECYRQAVLLKPEFVKAHNNLGVALKDQGNLAEAIACYRRALQYMPDCAEAQNNLGVALKAQGDPAEAIACYHRALRRKPDYANCHNNLGIALAEQGDLPEAIASFRRAVQLKPDCARYHFELANALQDLGKAEEAVACYRRTLELDPDLAEAHNNLGLTLQAQGRLDDALACYQQALQRRPDLAEAHNNVGLVLQEQGNPDEAIACYQRALGLRPDYAEAHSNLVLTLQYREGVTPQGLAEAHAEYDRRHAAPLRRAWRTHENARDADRRLRLGFVSPDFGSHPVGHFLLPALRNLDRSECEVLCYSDRSVADAVTEQLKAASARWQDVFAASDELLAERIRADRVDILFDLAGHTARNRLLAFARKPAPIQITWLGYVGTTGLGAMDYLLADRYHVPPQSEPFHCEKVLRMPDGYVCFAPPADAPPVGPLPALGQGRVTFGSFNNAAKITGRVIALWAEILCRVPGSRLILKYKRLEANSVRRRLLEQFAAHSVDADRLCILGESPHRELLEHYNQVDVALDTSPYSGGLTTCEALWMGVPVIACPGQTFAGRHAMGHLSNVGLTETIVHDFDEYVDRAVALASDLPRLAALRARLREQMAASPLCDGKRFAANLMKLLRGVWRDGCSQ